MFKSVRIQLTAWYLLIIMTISLTFSSLIYQGISLEYQRRINNIGNRILNENPNFIPSDRRIIFFLEDLQEARRSLVVFLAYLNGGVFILSAAAGYFLAGRTLQPIEKAMEDQKRFIGDASHELRTPLTALKTSIEVALRDKKITLKEAKNILQDNLEEVDRLKELTNGLLSLTRYQNNHQKINFQVISLTRLIQQAYKQIKPLADKKNLKIVFKINKNLKVKANQEEFKKLIVILLDNAIKYTKNKGKITISAKNKNNLTEIKIKDNGVGISSKDLPHIFERFYRVDSSRSKINVAGFGLGLSMATEIVKLHQGTITAASQINKGSTFTIKIPRK